MYRYIVCNVLYIVNIV